MTLAGALSNFSNVNSCTTVCDYPFKFPHRIFPCFHSTRSAFLVTNLRLSGQEQANSGFEFWMFLPRPQPKLLKSKQSEPTTSGALLI